MILLSYSGFDINRSIWIYPFYIWQCFTNENDTSVFFPDNEMQQQMQQMMKNYAVCFGIFMFTFFRFGLILHLTFCLLQFSNILPNKIFKNLIRKAPV